MPYLTLLKCPKILRLDRERGKPTFIILISEHSNKMAPMTYCYAHGTENRSVLIKEALLFITSNKQRNPNKVIWSTQS